MLFFILCKFSKFKEFILWKGDGVKVAQNLKLTFKFGYLPFWKYFQYKEY